MSVETLETVHPETKLGGVPFWLQKNETSTCPKCGGDMKFVSQLQAQLEGDFPANGLYQAIGKANIQNLILGFVGWLIYSSARMNVVQKGVFCGNVIKLYK